MKFEKDDVVVITKIVDRGFEGHNSKKKDAYMDSVGYIGVVFNSYLYNQYELDFGQSDLDFTHIDIFFEKELRHATDKEKFLFIVTSDSSCLRHNDE